MNLNKEILFWRQIVGNGSAYVFRVKIINGLSTFLKFFCNNEDDMTLLSPEKLSYSKIIGKEQTNTKLNII